MESGVLRTAWQGVMVGLESEAITVKQQTL